MGEALDQQAERRRHPAERTTSRWSGLLLLLIIPQAAFGYAMVGLVPEDSWVRVLHYILAPVVVLLVFLLLRAVLRLPWHGRRERFLLVLCSGLALLVVFQGLSGLWMRWGLMGAGDLMLVHVGLGLLTTLFVTVAHVASILPSILVSARREHADLSTKYRRGGS